MDGVCDVCCGQERQQKTPELHAQPKHLGLQSLCQVQMRLDLHTAHGRGHLLSHPVPAWRAALIYTKRPGGGEG